MKLGKTEIDLSRQGLGCMSMSEFYGQPIPDEKGINLIRTAYENGVNFFDTADVYAYGRNESLLGKGVSTILTEGVRRDQLVIATKCGILRDEYDTTRRGIDNSKKYIKTACMASLKRLGDGVAYIDLFYIHRIAAQGAQIDESMQAMAELLEEGHIRAVGLSEADSATIKKANAALLHYTNGKHQIAAVQSEYSLLTRNVEADGVLNACRDLGITFVAYSPLSRALLTGEIESAASFEEGDFRKTLPRFQEENLRHNRAIVAKVQEIVESRQCLTAQVSLAWVMSHPGVVPIPGTTKVGHLMSNIAATSLQLSAEELRSLNQLTQAKGYRYAEAAMKAYGFDDELESEVPTISSKL